MSSGKEKRTPAVASPEQQMRDRLKQMPLRPIPKKPKTYTVFQCKKCNGTPKMMYDDLVPAMLICVHCESRISPKIISPP